MGREVSLSREKQPERTINQLMDRVRIDPSDINRPVLIFPSPNYLDLPTSDEEKEMVDPSKFGSLPTGDD